MRFYKALDQTWDKVIKLLEFCDAPQQIKNMMHLYRETNRTRFRTKLLNIFLDMGLISMTQPEKPNSSKQLYYTSEKGKMVLKHMKALK